MLGQNMLLICVRLVTDLHSNIFFRICLLSSNDFESKRLHRTEMEVLFALKCNRKSFKLFWIVLLYICRLHACEFNCADAVVLNDFDPDALNSIIFFFRSLSVLCATAAGSRSYIIRQLIPVQLFPINFLICV